MASLSDRLLQAAKDIQALNESATPGGVTLWKLIRVVGGGELLEKTVAPVLPSEQLDFELTRLPVILSAYSVFLKSWPHPTYRALMSDRDLGRKFFLAEFIVYVETVLGHANWNAIVATIRAVHFALNEPKGVSTDAENLRLEVEAFQKGKPKVYADIKSWAEINWFSPSPHGIKGSWATKTIWPRTTPEQDGVSNSMRSRCSAWLTKSARTCLPSSETCERFPGQSQMQDGETQHALMFWVSAAPAARGNALDFGPNQCHGRVVVGDR
ncbi:MAG: hypothetical protein WBX22_14665 [Silvibacterium sp.]